MAKLFGAAFVAGFLIWCTSIALKGMGPSPARVFEMLLQDAESVSDLDGFVSKRNGYDVQIRFIAEEDWVFSIPSMGFREADCSGVRSVIRFSILRVAAWPIWRPEDIKEAVCFRRMGPNGWSPNGRDVLLVTPEGGWVYFAGEGPPHDRALPDYGLVESDDF